MLLLENVSRSASGMYVCQSFDFESGFDAEDSVNITVHCKSMFFCRSCSMADVGEMMSAFIFMVTNTFFFFLRSGSNCGDTKGEGSEPGGRSPLNLQCLVFFTHIDSMV